MEEEEKQRLQHDLHILTERLAAINEGLARKIAIRNDYDRTIAETEAAYKKVGTWRAVKVAAYVPLLKMTLSYLL